MPLLEALRPLKEDDLPVSLLNFTRNSYLDSCRKGNAVSSSVVAVIWIHLRIPNPFAA